MLCNLKQKGIIVWSWPAPGAKPNTKREITTLQIHIQINDQPETVSPEYIGKSNCQKAMHRVVKYLHNKYCHEHIPVQKR